MSTPRNIRHRGVRPHVVSTLGPRRLPGATARRSGERTRCAIKQPLRLRRRGLA
jgi:hypothetical protein